FRGCSRDSPLYHRCGARSVRIRNIACLRLWADRLAPAPQAVARMGEGRGGPERGALSARRMQPADTKRHPQQRVGPTDLRCALGRMIQMRRPAADAAGQVARGYVTPSMQRERVDKMHRAWSDVFEREQLDSGTSPSAVGVDHDRRTAGAVGDELEMAVVERIGA